MEPFGLIGAGIGALGFIFALSAIAKINKLVKKLKEQGVLEEDFEIDEDEGVQSK